MRTSFRRGIHRILHRRRVEPCRIAVRSFGLSVPSLFPKTDCTGQAKASAFPAAAVQYNTLHLYDRWCALAGGFSAAVPVSRSVCGAAAAGDCRCQPSVSACRGCRKEGRIFRSFPCGVLPSLLSRCGHSRSRKGRRSKLQPLPRFTEGSPSSRFAFSTVFWLKPFCANRRYASADGISSRVAASSSK